MRVVMISRELPPVGGGAGYVALNLAYHLAQRDHEVHVVTMHHGKLEEREKFDGVEIHRLRVGRNDADSSYVPEMARFVRRARRLVRQLASEAPFDVAHAHAIVPDGLVLTATDSRARTVVTAHGSDVPGYNPDRFQLLHRLIRPAWHRAVRRPDVLTAPSEHLRGLILEAGSSRHVEVIPNGIDTSMFAPARKDSSILAVTRLVKRKNIELLLLALRRVSLPTVVNIVGDGPERTRLEALAHDLPQHDVRFHGWLAHRSAEWKQLYERSRFFVFPSSSENFPINLLEAQLARMVVIASGIPGNREVLGSAARYLDELSEDGLVSALQDALAVDEEQLEREGAQAEQRVLECFSWERVTDAFEGLYTDG